MTFDFKSSFQTLSAREHARTIDIAERPAPASIVYRAGTAVDFTMRDVYQFSRHPRVLRSCQKALEENGLSSASSRLVTGTTRDHVRCEGRLSEMLGTGSSLLFHTRSQAVLSLVSCIANERDCFYLSRELSAPFVDAAYLIDAECVFFDPTDTPALKVLLERSSNRGNKFVVIDAVSESTGATRDISTLLTIARQLKADVIVDEVSSFGFVGPRGCGIFDSYPEISSGILCSLLDFSCLMGLKGAALTGVPELISLILARSTAIESEVPISPVEVAALLKSFDMLELAVSERSSIQGLVRGFVSGLQSEGWLSLSVPDVPVVNLPFESHRTAREFCQALFEKGILAEVIGGRAERSADARVRFIIGYGHTEAMINAALQAISSVKKRLLP